MEGGGGVARAVEAHRTPELHSRRVLRYDTLKMLFVLEVFREELYVSRGQ